MKSNYRIAVLLTCFNRREKTIASLASLFKSCDTYNSQSDDGVVVEVFLTDDGCTDGTAEAVLNTFPERSISIVPADGNAYWAGGMRLAWQAAIDTARGFDFYLLINDDTTLKAGCVSELVSTHRYALANYGKGGVYTGFICSSNDENRITYGAEAYKQGLLYRTTLLRPIGEPQSCDMTNGNILLVAKNVVGKIGILDKVFVHSAADLDYGIRATRAGFPVLTTASVCGVCDNDHDDVVVEQAKVKAMTLQERKEYLNKPNVKQYHDSLSFFGRYNKTKFVLLWISYRINLYLPALYYKIYTLRGH